MIKKIFAPLLFTLFIIFQTSCDNKTPTSQKNKKFITESDTSQTIEDEVLKPKKEDKKGIVGSWEQIGDELDNHTIEFTPDGNYISIRSEKETGTYIYDDDEKIITIKSTPSTGRSENATFKINFKGDVMVWTGINESGITFTFQRK